MSILKKQPLTNHQTSCPDWGCTAQKSGLGMHQKSHIQYSIFFGGRETTSGNQPQINHRICSLFRSLLTSLRLSLVRVPVGCSWPPSNRARFGSPGGCPGRLIRSPRVDLDEDQERRKFPPTLVSILFFAETLF